VRHVGPYDAQSLIRALTSSAPDGAGLSAAQEPGSDR
jgi:hypothetical protein